MNSNSSRQISVLLRLLLTAAAAQRIVNAQQATLDQVLERLTRLERENENLRTEVKQLRGEVEALRGAPPEPELTVQRLDERLQVDEHRVQEQAQSKVEASQKFPIRFTGMLLANAFHNGLHSGGQDNPTVASRTPVRHTAGLTFRQSILGLEYRGPKTFLNGTVHGSVAMDFFDGLSETNAYAPMRLRTASIGIDWATRSLSWAQDKPLIAVRDPSSFSYQGISPLTGAGNLWRWQQQLRFEQRIGAGRNTLQAQAAIVETSEDAGVSAAVLGTGDRRRPGLQGRFLFTHRIDEERRIEIAPAFHVSSSRMGGQKIPSSLFATDWFIKPLQHLELSGTFFTGKNISHFGATRQSVTLTPAGALIPVHAQGGWGQLTVPFTMRLAWNVFAGIHDDRNQDILIGGIAANRMLGSNLMYHLAPNVIGSFEMLQIRTTYFGAESHKNNRYDLSLAYFF